MATKFVFDGTTIELPGAYSTIKSGETNPPSPATFGRILIIDTGNGAEFGGGSGIDGELLTGLDSIYSVDNIADYRSLTKGGLWWLLGLPLFFPDGYASRGVPNVYFARAATTTCANMVFTFTNGAASIQMRDEGIVGNGRREDETLATGNYTVTAVGATGDTHTPKITEGATLITLGSYTVPAVPLSIDLTAAAIAEAINDLTGTHGYTATSDAAIITVTARQPRGTEVASDANAYTGTYVVTGTATGTAPATLTGGVDGVNLTRGFAAVMEAGEIDATKYLFKFYRGTYKGEDFDGDPWDNISVDDAVPLLYVKSPEFSTVQEFITWMTNNSTFNQYFKLETSSATGAFVAGDLTNYSDYNLAYGGTETYSTTKLDEVLDAVTENDFTFILCNDYGDDAQSADNGKLLAHIVNEAKFEKFLVVGGGEDSTKFTQTYGSIPTAQYYDSDRVWVVHGGVGISTQWASTGFKNYPAIYKAAEVLGRIAGQAPQIPGTFKSLGHNKETHVLSKKEKIQCLDNGVLCTEYDSDFGKFVIVQDVNSLQRNDYEINDDGTSHVIQIKNITSQLNKEIVINAKNQLFGNPSGVNQYTLSTKRVRDWLIGYLQSRTITPTTDNLIKKFYPATINVTKVQDSYQVTYKFTPNSEITKVFFTGFMIN